MTCWAVMGTGPGQREQARFGSAPEDGGEGRNVVAGAVARCRPVVAFEQHEACSAHAGLAVALKAMGHPCGRTSSAAPTVNELPPRRQPSGVTLRARPSGILPVIFSLT